MPVREFEYMHGAVLAKILRKDEPLQLTLVETNSDETNSVYKIASSERKESVLYIKHSKTPRTRNKDNSPISTFNFTFTSMNLADLKRYSSNSLILALVCAQQNYKANGSEICVLYNEKILQLIDIDAATTQVISVISEPKKSLRVRGTLTNNEDLIIPRKQIESLVF